MPEKNIPLLKRLRTRFLRMRHPQHFRMKQIAIKTSCGAAGCLIYHTLDLAGYTPRLKPESELNDSQCGSRSDYDFISPKGRKVKNPFDKAADLLGLTRDINLTTGEMPEAHALFQDYSLQTPKDAAARIEKIIAEAQQ